MYRESEKGREYRDLQNTYGTGTKRPIDQWNGIENLEMDLQFCGQLIFGKAGKNIQWGRGGTVFSANGVGKILQPLAEE